MPPARPEPARASPSRAFSSSVRTKPGSGSAFAEFTEGEKGKLAAGYLADRFGPKPIVTADVASGSRMSVMAASRAQPWRVSPTMRPKV